MFYELTHDAFSNKDAAWAAWMGPLQSGMPFLKPFELLRLEASWRLNPLAPGIHVDVGGRYWPDIMGNGAGSPPKFVSEKVVNSLLSLNVEMGRITEIPIASVGSKYLESVSPPKYFVVETLPGVNVDFRASNLKVDDFGKPVLNPLPKPWPPIIKIRHDSWNGADLFDYRNWGEPPYLNLLCSENVKLIAARDGWKNVRFIPISSV